MEETTKSLFINARQNALAADILYDQGVYPEALYMLAQAVEKGYKAANIEFGIISFNELSDVNHNALKLLKKGLTRLNLNTESIQDLLNLSSFQGQVPASMNSEIGDARPADFASPSLEEIDQIIASTETIKKIFAPLFTTGPGLKEVLLVASKHFGIEADKIKKLTDQQINELASQIDTRAAACAVHWYTLTVFGLVCTPHMEHTRYPRLLDNGLVDCPQLKYTQSNPIVAKQREISELLKESLDFFINNDLG